MSRRSIVLVVIGALVAVGVVVGVWAIVSGVQAAAEQESVNEAWHRMVGIRD